MADTQKENAAPTSRAAASQQARRPRRPALGRDAGSLFLLSPDCPERKALAERVVQRPDDPAAWYAVLQNIPEAIKPDARCRLFRTGDAVHPQEPARVVRERGLRQIWLGFAVEQAKLGQRQGGRRRSGIYAERGHRETVEGLLRDLGAV